MVKNTNPIGPSVGVMMKFPQPGEVKTRLGKIIGMNSAAEFYAGAVAWLLERLRSHRIRTVIFYTPKGCEEKLRAMYQLPESIPLVPQSGEDLGDRIHHSLSWMNRRDQYYPCVIGSDSPDLPVERIERAHRLMKNGEKLILGPAEDGGYYLVGCSPVQRRYFQGIDWSTSRVLEQTIERAQELVVTPCKLSPWRDIDTLEDLMDRLPEY